ncbi:hypothetical protein Ani05nite_74530 [Amorphoplanes nipponensis]|uniref:Uncharacterized protein n=2 Tax=Actinoplanes nipponensis TaxID=135950 RepID=A0A919JVT7_9ACTN|nr:hypothetical protein Ani05nite_74530 [Actinoplanes nipponensis]
MARHACDLGNLWTEGAQAMADELPVTEDELRNLATKLDEFARTLSETERGVLLTIMHRFGRPAAEPAPAVRAGLLSEGFRDAYERGRGTAFRTVAESAKGGSIQDALDGPSVENSVQHSGPDTEPPR